MLNRVRLRRKVGYEGAWVAWVGGCVGCMGQIFKWVVRVTSVKMLFRWVIILAWVAWVKYIFAWVFGWVKIFYVGPKLLCVSFFLLRRSAFIYEMKLIYYTTPNSFGIFLFASIFPESLTP